MKLRGILMACTLIGAAQAGQFGVTVNVPNLSNDNLALVFQLTNANSAGNTATITNFQFNNAAVNGALSFVGGGSGSIAGGVVITDTSNPNLATIPFQPSTSVASVTFNVNLTENFTNPGVGDFFGMNILQNGNPLNSNDPSGADLFLAALIGANGVSPVGYEFVRGIAVTVGDPFPENGTVPEPSTLLLMGAGLAAVWGTRSSTLISLPDMGAGRRKTGVRS
ncbi:MAG: PEP-CTERM sorting domain-containing protein [Bryobacterales bacterium]|nr:PEP-CTERM sorting domain-containing protein [Bryobacterales bacterium]